MGDREVKFKKWYEVTNAQRIERWENVLRVLQALTTHQRRRHWDMSNWGIETECGTVACAAGHCGLDPWFRRRGFRLGPVKITKDIKEQMVYGASGFGRLTSVSPEDFFGYKGTREIFLNTDIRSVSQVIKEVKTHIKDLKDPSNTWLHSEKL